MINSLSIEDLWKHHKECMDKKSMDKKSYVHIWYDIGNIWASKLLKNLSFQKYTQIFGP
jgi:hypothetical protein